MNSKLLILDLDGTLTNSKKEITPFTKEVLLNAQRKGLRIALASGRPTYGIVPLAEELEMQKYHGYILAFNGGRVIEYGTNTIMFEQALPNEVLPILYNRTKEAAVSILSYNGPKIITENINDKYVQYESFLNKMELQETDNFLRDLELPADKCLAVAEPELLIPLAEKLKEEIGDKINIFRSEAFFLELVPKGIDKAASISNLINKIGIKQENTIAIGDGFNDLTMIKFAGLGVAMANAQEAVKAEADIITEHTNDEDGVAHFVNALLKKG